MTERAALGEGQRERSLGGVSKWQNSIRGKREQKNRFGADKRDDSLVDDDEKEQEEEEGEKEGEGGSGGGTGKKCSGQSGKIGVVIPEKIQSNPAIA